MIDLHVFVHSLQQKRKKNQRTPLIMCWYHRKRTKEIFVSVEWGRRAVRIVVRSVPLSLNNGTTQFFSFFLSSSSIYVYMYVCARFLRNPFLIPHFSFEKRVPVVSPIAYIMASTTCTLFRSFPIMLYYFIWYMHTVTNGREKKPPSFVCVYAINRFRKFLMKGIVYMCL
jgi:hypothetical protein